VLGNADKLWRAGCNIVRMNMRNCGGRDYEMARRTPTLYHSGLSADVDRVMRYYLHREQLTSIALIGYSMGGNLVLKLAGDLDANAPEELHAVVGVSPAVDLKESADALHSLPNRLYEQKFLRALLKRFRRKTMLFPRAFDPRVALNVHSIRDFDEYITALYSGFRSADDYYSRAAAARVIERIHVPTLILHATDDPFIRFTAETRAKIEANPNISLIETRHGGHCARPSASCSRTPDPTPEPTSPARRSPSLRATTNPSIVPPGLVPARTTSPFLRRAVPGWDVPQRIPPPQKRRASDALSPVC
jgi:predicted alpha/beta-fold hydrolase